MRKVAESTIRRLSLYLRFLEEFDTRGVATVSSGELASRGGTTSAQVRKDLSFFGSFGKRGMGYAVPEMVAKLREILSKKVDLETFFREASLNRNARLITGVICGYRIEEIEDPLMRKIRYLDKLVDELAKGWKMEKILRSPAPKK